MTAAAVLDFWFGDRPCRSYRPAWFEKNAAFDAECRERFLPDVQFALAGGHGGWAATPDGTLALLILLDQLPRNLYRGTARAFAGDRRALEIARQAVADGRDQALSPVERVFVYLPFEHSENLADQRRCLALTAALRDGAGGFLDMAHDYAVKHFEVIRAFGRFPHRNQALGRVTTPAEARFLSQPGSSF